MAYNGAVYAGTLASINVAAAGSLAVLNPLLLQLDFSLFGSLGVGALQANLAAQLSASISMSASLSIGIANPLAGFTIAAAAIGQLSAQISLALAGSIPTISLEVSAQLSAQAAFAASLTAQIGGLEAIIQGGLAIKLPALDLAARLQAALSAGPLFVLSWENVTLSSAGASINADFGAGMTLGANSLAPGDTVYGVLLVTKTPAAWAAIQATMLVA